MSNSFETDLSTMQGAAQHVYQVNEQIQSALASLLDRVDSLNGAWKGSAATSFQDLKQRWHQDATRLNDALRSIGDRLKQAHGTYGSNEDAVGQSMSTISSRLG